MDVEKAVETAKRHFHAITKGEDIVAEHLEEASFVRGEQIWRVTLAVTRRLDPSETLGLTDQTHTEYKIIEFPEDDPDHCSIMTRDSPLPGGASG